MADGKIENEDFNQTVVLFSGVGFDVDELKALKSL